MKVYLQLFLAMAIYTSSLPSMSQVQTGNVTGQVLVKLKPEFAYLNSNGNSLRANTWKEILPNFQIRSATPLGQSVNVKNKFSARKSGNTSIDIRLYHQLAFDADLPVDVAIDYLMKSGVIEIAEPVTWERTDFVPNDRSIKSQYYLETINAYEAWDISKGSEEIIIAIIDSGVDMDHPDLVDNIFLNLDDPIDGTDNDNDGYIDNYYGWDFAGDDYLTLEGDNDPNAELGNITHGTLVSGCASASTNNIIGIAGVGFNSKLMILKHSAENDDRDNGNALLSNVLQGIIYAATHGADVINASYGGTTYSQIAQDIYQFAAEEYGAVVIAAAGNSASADPHFPADYDYVLSVAATTSSDTKAGFSNFGYNVDVSAPGQDIYTTTINGGYTSTQGTSFSSPIVAGVAGLLKAKYRDYSGVQIAELLRVSSDPSFKEKLSTSQKDQMGNGIVDAANALIFEGPAIRLTDSYLETPNGDVAKAGDEAEIWGVFKNFLKPVNGLSIKISSTNNFITVLKDEISISNIETLQEISNESEPFVIKVASNVPANTEVALKLTYEADGYSDYQYISILVNPTYFNINENLVATSIAGNGRIGYQDTDQSLGLGFVYQDVNMLYEMGVIMATSSSKLVSSVRSTGGNYDNDFRVIGDIVKEKPGTISDSDIWGSFDDSRSNVANRLNVDVNYRSFVWREDPYTKMIIVEYDVKNSGSSEISNFYLGLYADWDINQNDNNDKANWNEETNTGYVYTPDAGERWVGAIQSLTGNPNYWAIDNDSNIEGNPFGVYDGYSDSEKFTSISSGIGRSTAGELAGGTDVSHTVSSGPYSIPVGKSVRIAFALHGGTSIDEVVQSARDANVLYANIAVQERPNEHIVDNEPNGLEHSKINGLSIFPNPTTKNVNLRIDGNLGKKVQVMIRDIAGREMDNSNYINDELTHHIDLPLVKGVYIIQIQIDNTIDTRRIVLFN